MKIHKRDSLVEIALKECEIVSLHLVDNYPNLKLMMRECKNSTMILAAIAKNPNTPPNILKDLFKYFPVEILNNRALSLIILENPNFLSGAYETNPEKYHIFGMDGTPLFFIEWGVNHFEKGTRESAIYSIKSHEILEKFSKHHSHLVRTCVADNPKTPSHVLEVAPTRRVRFLVGANDPIVSVKDARQCAEQFPDGACYVVPGLAHGVNKWGSSFVDHVRYFLATQLGDWF